MSTVQAVLNQVSGIIVFFILSKYLSKAGLGQINWSLAVLMVIFSILGFGLEHVAVKKAATGTNTGLLLQAYLFHVLVVGCGFLAMLFIIQFWIPGVYFDKQLFFLLSVSQCLSFFATPFRQIVSGLEKFKALFVMSSCANIIKVLALFVLAFMQQVTVIMIIEVYLLASAIEFGICIFIYRVSLQLPVIPGYNRQGYLSFIKEALPQLGITIFNTALARMDWILLGILSTSIMVAEYSFTNKLFELSTLPLLILAPVIFPKISKMFASEENGIPEKKIQYLKILVQAEIVVAVWVAMAMNICWKDIIDPLTNYKYGSSTSEIIFIMSFAMPLVYLNNIFWNILFAKGKMNVLFQIFFFAFLINMTADAVLIPLFHAKGAAFGFVIALAAQTVFYYRKTDVPIIKKAFFHLFPVMASALLAGLISVYLVNPFIWQLSIATGMYLFLLYIMKELSFKDWITMKRVFVSSI